MAAFAPSTVKRFTFFDFIFIAIFCSNMHSGNAQNLPTQSLAKAFLCFSNRYIYNGCNEAYRLNESGNLNVPPDATDIFCSGPCLAETQLVLKCIADILSDFTFYNSATVQDIRDVIHGGCSFTSRRGNFNLEISNAQRLQSFLISFSSLIFIVGFYILI